LHPEFPIVFLDEALPNRVSVLPFFRDFAINAFQGLIAERGNRGSAEEQKR
jgi:hypothetical protein